MQKKITFTLTFKNAYIDRKIVFKLLRLVFHFKIPVNYICY